MLFQLMSMYLSLWDQLLPVSSELWMVGWVDVVPLDVDVHVPVGPAVLMVEAKRVHHLMLININRK
jgi:hypothetical protein